MATIRSAAASKRYPAGVSAGYASGTLRPTGKLGPERPPRSRLRRKPEGRPPQPGQPAAGRRRHVFERFTDRARRVVVLAQEEARLLNHNYIGTEHILLGLIHEGEGVAAKALESLGHLARGRAGPGGGDHRPGRLDAVRPHPLHAPGQEGARALPAGGAPARPQLHRHRAHPPRPDPRGRGRRRPGAGEAGRRPVPGPPAGHPAPLRLRRPARSRRPPAAPAAPRPPPPARSCSTSSAATSPSWPGRRSSTRSSAGTRRSSGSCRCSPGGPRTTPSSSASPASARPPSSRAWPRRSSPATCPRP